jgi:hypothetical protein
VEILCGAWGGSEMALQITKYDMKELEDVLRWEENWFHEVTQVAPPTRLIALRMVRHAIWYLRAQRRSMDDVQAANLLMRRAVEIQNDSLSKVYGLERELTAGRKKSA